MRVRIDGNKLIWEDGLTNHDILTTIIYKLVLGAVPPPRSTSDSDGPLIYAHETRSKAKA